MRFGQPVLLLVVSLAMVGYFRASSSFSLQTAAPRASQDRSLIQYVENYPGATADAQLAACLSAIPQSGTCDARGYGATTQTLAATIRVPSGKTLLFDPTTSFVPATASVNIFEFEPNSVIRGLTFHCGTVPYAGNVFQNDKTRMYSNGEHTELANITVDPTCGHDRSGAALSLSSTSEDTGIAFLNVHDWRTDGLGAGLYMTASGTGFVNGNHFINMQWSTSPVGWHITGAGGSIVGNMCIACSYEQNRLGTNGVLIDGSGGSVQHNLFIGAIWDTPVAIRIIHTTASFNIFMASYFEGVVSDVENLNTFIPGGSASAQPTAIFQGLRVNHNAENDPQWASLDLFDTGSKKDPHKYIRVVGGVLQVVNSSFSEPILTLDDSGKLAAKASLKAGSGSSVPSLPPASANPGSMIYVTDSTPIKSEGQQCRGNSHTKALAFSNGTTWKCF